MHRTLTKSHGAWRFGTDQVSTGRWIYILPRHQNVFSQLICTYSWQKVLWVADLFGRIRSKYSWRDFFGRRSHLLVVTIQLEESFEICRLRFDRLSSKNVAHFLWGEIPDKFGAQWALFPAQRWAIWLNRMLISPGILSALDRRPVVSRQRFVMLYRVCQNFVKFDSKLSLHRRKGLVSLNTDFFQF